MKSNFIRLPCIMLACIMMITVCGSSSSVTAYAISHEKRIEDIIVKKEMQLENQFGKNNYKVFRDTNNGEELIITQSINKNINHKNLDGEMSLNVTTTVYAINNSFSHNPYETTQLFSSTTIMHLEMLVYTTTNGNYARNYKLKSVSGVFDFGSNNMVDGYVDMTAFATGGLMAANGMVETYPQETLSANLIFDSLGQFSKSINFIHYRYNGANWGKIALDFVVNIDSSSGFPLLINYKFTHILPSQFA